jgi:hypothetical protein
VGCISVSCSGSPNNHAVKSVQNWLISSLLVLSYIDVLGLLTVLDCGEPVGGVDLRNLWVLSYNILGYC